MTCDVSTQSFKLEAVNLSFGGEGKACITPVNGLSGGEYFVFSTPTIKKYVWFDLDGASVDPAPAGYTGIEAEIVTGHSVADVIAAIKLAVETDGDALVTASTDGLSCRIENFDLGAVLEDVGAGTSGFTVGQEAAGFGGALGKTKNAIEMSLEVETLDVTSNQTGSIPLDTLQTGVSVSLTADLMELTEARFKAIVGEGHGSFVNTAGGDVVGFGTSKLYKSSFEFAGKLVGHPVSLDASDRSRDFVFWKTVPVMSSINYDGTSEQLLSVEFKALIDETKDAKLSLGTLRGDWRQDLR